MVPRLWFGVVPRLVNEKSSWLTKIVNLKNISVFMRIFTHMPSTVEFAVKNDEGQHVSGPLNFKRNRKSSWLTTNANLKNVDVFMQIPTHMASAIRFAVKNNEG